MAGEPVVDMQWGVYRKVYSGFIWGDRLNSVSMEAEAWFWRLHAVADDLGNLAANWPRLCIEAGGKRGISPEQAEALTKELADAKLIRIYSVGSDNYAHIHGFEDRQPANKNGRRIQRHPVPPKNLTNTASGKLGNPTEPDSNCRESKSPNPNPSPMPIPNPNPNPTPTPAIASATGSANRFLASRTIATGNAPPGFVEFYNAYPTGYKADHDGLLAMWNARGLEIDAQTIMTGLSAWITSERWLEGYVVEAKKFIETKKWRDTPPPPKVRTDRSGKVIAPAKPGIEQLPSAGQDAFRAWWRLQDRDAKEAFAKSKGVPVGVVDSCSNWRHVPAAWGDAIAEKTL